MVEVSDSQQERASLPDTDEQGDPIIPELEQHRAAMLYVETTDEGDPLFV